MDDSIDSSNFSAFNLKGLNYNKHGLAVYVKERLPFEKNISLENSADSYLCFGLVILHSASYLFFLYCSPSSSSCIAFDSISSNIDEVLFINPSANFFVFGDLTIYHQDWLTYFGGTDTPGELCNNFSISNDLTQMVNFPTPDFDSRQSCSSGFINFF